MRIQKNISALNAHRHLGGNNNKTQLHLEKLASGYRVNRAGDDAAGLAVSEEMRAQITALTQSRSNAEDGISLLQTAEGALQEVHTMLNRMVELSTQAANGTYDDGDRQSLQQEAANLINEVDRIASTANFNGHKLFDGSLRNLNPLNQPLGSVVTELPKDAMNLVFMEITHDVMTSQTYYGDVGPAGYDDVKNILQTQIVPQAVNAIMNTLPDAFSYLKDSSIGIGLELDMDPNNRALASVTAGVAGPLNQLNMTYKLTVNIPSLNLGPGNTLTADSRDKLEATIAHEMTHALMDEAMTAGMMGYNGGVGFWESYEYPGWFTEGCAQAVCGGSYDNNDWVKNGLGIDETTSETSIKNALASSANKLGSGTDTSEYGTGYLATMYLGYKASGGTAVTAPAIASGLDKILKDLREGKSLDEAITTNTGYAGRTDIESKFAADGAAFVKQLVQATGTGSGGLVAGDLAKGAAGSGDLLPDAPLSMNLFALNLNGSTVENKYPAGYTVLSGGTNFAGGKPIGSGNSGGTTPGGGGPAVPGTPTTPSIPVGGLKLFVGDGEDMANDMLTVYFESMSAKGLGIRDVNISTQDGALAAIGVTKKAIDLVSSQRSSLGASQNRLEHTINHLGNTVENLQASESRIRDTDMAKEMSGLIASQILTQASQAMLAQANQRPQGILQMLQ